MKLSDETRAWLCGRESSKAVITVSVMKRNIIQCLLCVAGNTGARGGGGNIHEHATNGG